MEIGLPRMNNNLILILGKTQKIEEFCLRKLYNSDFFWS